MYGIIIFTQTFAMRRIFFLLIIIASFASCEYTTGSGNIVTENRSAGSFSGISVGGDFDVEVKIGSTTEVKVEADDNIIKHIETRVSGNILRIRTEDLHNYRDVHMKVYITTPSLNKISASASARVNVDDLLKSNERLSFNASSAGNINAEVEAPEVEADASSGAMGLLSHRAVYRLSLADSDSGSSLTRVRGGLVLEWRAACDGWLSQQRLGFVAEAAEGSSV